VLKKAGIVTAAAAAGLLALSPLAMAHDGGRHHHGDRDGNTQSGLLNLQNTNVQVPVQACNNSIVEGVLGILAKDQRNSDSHKGKCNQHNSADNGGKRHHHHH
jgi:hypothetical protein